MRVKINTFLSCDICDPGLKMKWNSILPLRQEVKSFIRKSLSDYILFQNLEISPLDRSSHLQLFKIYGNKQFNSGPEHAENLKLDLKFSKFSVCQYNTFKVFESTQ